jgi:hypothetical protein
MGSVQLTRAALPLGPRFVARLMLRPKHKLNTLVLAGLVLGPRPARTRHDDKGLRPVHYHLIASER